MTGNLRLNVAVSMVSGLLLALAFPKFSQWWLAWVALAPFFWALIHSKSWKEALLCGFAFGIIFFGINLFWVTSLFCFAGWWAALGWVSLTLFQTLFILLLVIVLLPLRDSRLRVVIIPMVWTAVEWLRSLGPLGNTLGILGSSQAQCLPLIQIASFTTVYGVSFLAALVNAAVAEMIGKPATKRRGFLLFIFLLFVIVLGYGYRELQGSRDSLPRLKLALIQPNIDQMVKLDPAKVSLVYEIHERLTRQAAKERSDIIIWPETAVFTYLLRDPVLFPRIKQLAIDSGAWLVIGTPHYDDKGKTYNSVISISPSGRIVSRYDKERLVPFGEYLPFRKILYSWLKGTGYYEQGFDADPSPVLLSAGKVKIAAAVCFESTFPGLIKKRVKEGSDFILTVTNDGWFGTSSVPYFHLDDGVFRAIENRKYFIQVGNTGISAVIDPYGRVLSKTELNQRTILSFEL